MPNEPQPRTIVLRNRQPGESRLAQSKRIGIPETTLRWIETKNSFGRNELIAADRRRRLGLDQVAA